MVDVSDVMFLRLLCCWFCCRYVKTLMSEAGLSVREDAIGNIFGRWEGSEASLPAVGSGSHTDAIPYAGKYDGVLGVLGAIEAIRALQRVNFQPKRAIEAIMFASEEPTRFGFGCLGSRAMAKSGKIFDILRGAMDANNVSFVDAARSAGYGDVEEKLESSGLGDEAYSAFVELHIEQGPILEKEGKHHIPLNPSDSANSTISLTLRSHLCVHFIYRQSLVSCMQVFQSVL
jgi:ureidoglycolate amidohydrolase